MSDSDKVKSALEKTTAALLAELDAGGFWTGELSSSALSTAVAVIALHLMGEREFEELGLRWLAENQNRDGGWGDTIRSESNLSTTALVWAAFGATRREENFRGILGRAEEWLWKNAGSREALPEAIIARYGKDRTFSVPILMTLALSGRLGSAGWQSVLPLPFELAALPQSWFGAMQLPVVSYALPALIAIGQTIHHHAPSKNPFARIIRGSVRDVTLRRLEEIQPPNGGFLEATPLTAFVTMALASMGRREHPVATRGAAFLKKSVRADGSWPIDTNLTTWLTTLSVKALARQSDVLGAERKKRIREWLLGQQYRKKHLYTGAAPGGWAWTDLPGGVPDADDTAGALLALAALGPAEEGAVENGIVWLLNLQNRDGGIPTFCRGWGTLPFDRSAPELTVHAMEAWKRGQKFVTQAVLRRIDAAMERAHRFLIRSQRKDGAWIPLWFGNEHAPEHENPVYGTARTLIGLNELEELGFRVDARMRAGAIDFLRKAQAPAGGWGGNANSPESIEETALTVEALGESRGAARLIELLEEKENQPAPIGLYFARLWYFERLYPLIFATSALGRIASKQF